MRTERMARPRDRVIAGVCAGFAEHTGVPVGAARAGAAALTLLGGGGALLYAWLWATVPSSPVATEATEGARRRDLAARGANLVTPTSSASAADGTAASTAHHSAPGQRTSPAGAPAGTPTPEGSDAPAPASTATSSTHSPREQGTAPDRREWVASAEFSAILVGSALLAIGAILIANRLGASIPAPIVIPLVVVGTGLALSWQQVAELLPGSASRPAARRYANVVGAVGLVTAGVLLLFTTGETPSVGTMFGAAIAVLFAALLAIAPWLLRLTRALADERAARARELERESIAAHLHDSVLQTLAVIQQKAPAHSDVSRIARAQERELREWLYADGAWAEATPDLATALREQATHLEAVYPVTVEVVAIGQAPASGAEEIAAAAREAMTNAAKHAGGTITVTIETSPLAVRVDIMDRGPGFSIDTIPADRHGVTGSIRGRMDAVGGRAEFRRGPGGVGTVVGLEQPVAGENLPTAPAPEVRSPR